jgi:hypothetical protein
LFGTDYCRNLSAAFQFFQQGKINPNHFDLCDAHANAGVPQTCVEVSRILLPFLFLTWIRAKLFQRFYSTRRSTSRSGLSLLCAHRVARHAPGVDKAGGVEHAGAAVERAVQAVGVHHVGHHRPHPVPAVLAEHLHLPQLVQVLCQQHTDTSQISRTKLHTEISVANQFVSQ